MSEGFACLEATDADIQKLVMSKAHLGDKKCTKGMNKYVFKRRNDGINVINVHKTYEKIVLAARVIASIENPLDVCAISGPQYGQRAVLKFAKHTGCHPIAGRFTPGAFTNQIQKAFQEPRVLILTDPIVDHQAVREASYVNIPIIALCDTDAPLRYVDVAIPCNNKSPHAIGIVWWMLAREVLRIRGTLPRTSEWDVMPDLYFWRDPEEVEKEEQAQAQAQADEFATYDAPQTTEVDPAVDPAAAALAAAAAGITSVGGGAPEGQDWGVSGGAFTEDWSNNAAGDWGATTGADWGASAQ